MNKLDSEKAISRLWQESHLRHFFSVQAVADNSSETGPKLVQERRKEAAAIGVSKLKSRKLQECANSPSAVLS
jgi:hypothetical protein